jgi:hypothetical protein
MIELLDILLDNGFSLASNCIALASSKAASAPTMNFDRDMRD